MKQKEWMNMLTLAGFAQEKITPQLPVPMAGYEGIRQATGVHDDLYAHALVLQTKEKTITVVTLDLLSVDEELVQRVAAELTDLDISQEDLLLIATHTHSGPVGINETTTGIMKGTSYFLGEKNLRYIEFVAKRISKAIHQAYQKLEPQRLKIGKTTVTEVAGNRSRPEAPYDDQLVAIEFLGENGEQNLIVRYSCHPTVLNAENTLISADFPGALYQQFSESYAHVMFINGACGDISTRFTRQSSDFDEVERVGVNLERAIREALIKPVYEGWLDSVMSFTTSFKLQTKEPGDLSELQRQLEHETDKLKKISLHAAAEYARNHEGKQELTIPVSLLQFQRFWFIFMPVEIYSSMVIDKLSQDRYYTGCTNGYYTYLPDALAYASGEYEAYMTPFAEGQAELVMGQVSEWVDEMIDGVRRGGLRQ